MKSINIQLTDRRWLHDASQPQRRIHFRGAAVSDGAMRRTPEEIAKVLLESGKDAETNTEAWGQAVLRLNGFFSVVMEVWHFIECNSDHWAGAWHTDDRRRYQRWASGWASLPHVQDWAAVHRLQAEGVVDQDCVFTAGHACCRHGTGIPESRRRLSVQY